MEYQSSKTTFNIGLQYLKIMAKIINSDSIWVLSILDKYMADFRKDSKLFCSLFEKKKQIIGFLQSMKIDAKKYKALVIKTFKQQTGEMKKLAEMDLLKLKDTKDDKLTQDWFKQMIEQTGVFYEAQQKAYQAYQNANTSQISQPHQPQRGTFVKKQVQVLSQKNKDNCWNIEQLASFKAIDNLMQKNENQRSQYEILHQRKLKLLNLVSTKALTPDKYKATLDMFLKKLTNQQLISDYKFQLEGINDFHDGNVLEWFKDILEETKDKLDDQQNILQNLKKGILQQPKAEDIRISKSTVKQSKQKQKSSSPFNINDLMSFRVLDENLDNYTHNKQIYKQILEKKKKFLDLFKKGALPADKYKALLMKAISESKNQQIKETMEFQLSELSQFHQNNIQQWYKDIISSAELIIQDQQEILSKLEKGIKIPKNDDNDSDDIKFSDDQDIELGDDEKKEKVIPKSEKKQMKNQSSKNQKGSINFKQIFSLKALDQYMIEYNKNPLVFCSCFQRKELIFEMMKNGEINPQKYKQLQQKTLKITTNDKLKETVQMDLYDLKEMCDDNVNQWFESLINDSGFNYQDQQNIYNQFKGKKLPSDSKQIHLSTNSNIIQKPNINQLICFTAIQRLFQYCISKMDLLYYKQVVLKRQKLIDLVNQKRLVPSKYIQINKSAANKTDNVFLKSIIVEEETRLLGEFKGDEQKWFETLFKDLSVTPPVLKLPQNKDMKKINALPANAKIQYLIKKMATFDSLLSYYRKNLIQTQQNKYLKQYEKNKKKECIKVFDLILEDANLDVYNFADQTFPVIDENVFYGDNITMNKKKIDSYISLISKQIAAIKDYASKIKKSSNSQNLQICKKQIGKCEQNISYLKSWPNGDLILFPTIKQVKVQKYNLDIHSHLDRNQLQIIINHIDGMEDKLILKIYLVAFQNERFNCKVKNGPQEQIKVITKLPDKQMNQILKGDKKHLLVRFYEEGFFGGLTLVSQGYIQTGFTRANIIEGKTNIGSISISFILKVQKPSKPLVTEIMHYEMTTFPKYKHDLTVEQELLKNLSNYPKNKKS